MPRAAEAPSRIPLDNGTERIKPPRSEKPRQRSGRDKRALQIVRAEDAATVVNQRGNIAGTPTQVTEPSPTDLALEAIDHAAVDIDQVFRMSPEALAKQEASVGGRLKRFFFGHSERDNVRKELLAKWREVEDHYTKIAPTERLKAKTAAYGGDYEKAFFGDNPAWTPNQDETTQIIEKPTMAAPSKAKKTKLPPELSNFKTNKDGFSGDEKLWFNGAAEAIKEIVDAETWTAEDYKAFGMEPPKAKPPSRSKY